MLTTLGALALGAGLGILFANARNANTIAMLRRQLRVAREERERYARQAWRPRPPMALQTDSPVRDAAALGWRVVGGQREASS